MSSSAAPRGRVGTTLLAFLQTELAPTPGRARASMRIVVASLAATVLLMGLHVPHGSWIIWTIFQVSSEDAGASLIKGALRIVATLIGGLVGMLIVIGGLSS